MDVWMGRVAGNISCTEPETVETVSKLHHAGSCDCRQSSSREFTRCRGAEAQSLHSRPGAEVQRCRACENEVQTCRGAEPALRPMFRTKCRGAEVQSLHSERGAEVQRCRGAEAAAPRPRPPHPRPPWPRKRARREEKGGKCGKWAKNVENGRKMWKMGEKMWKMGENVEKWAKISFRFCLGKFPRFLSV